MKLRFAFTGAGVAMLAVACSMLADIPDSVRVVCEKPIRVRILNALDSLAIADVALPVYLGALDHLREIQETGGIRGCKLDYTFTVTDFSDPARSVAIYEDWKRQPDWNDVVAVFGVGSADALALGPKVTADKRVLISLAYNGTLASPRPIKLSVDVPETKFIPGTAPEMHETLFPTAVESKGYPYVFYPGTDYSTAIRIAMYHIAGIKPGARVGWVHCADNEFCLNPLPAGRTTAKDLGLQVGRDLPVELTADTPKYVDALASYFADEAAYSPTIESPNKPVSWLWSGNLTAGTFYLAAALGALQASEGHPSIPATLWPRAKEIIADTKIIANNYGFDESLVLSLCPRLPAGPAPCKRVFGIMPFLAFGEQSQNPRDMPAIVALHDKWRARDTNASYNDASAIIAAGLPVPTTRSVRYIQGYMNVKLFKMGMERLIDQGREVNGENLKLALETFSSEDTGDISAPLSFSADDHRPQSTVALYTLDFPGNAPGTKGTLKSVDSKRRIATTNSWLGW